MCEGEFWKRCSRKVRSQLLFSCGQILLLQGPALSPFSPAHQAWHWAESQALVLLQDVVLVDMRALMPSYVLKKGKTSGYRWWCFRGQWMQMKTDIFALLTWKITPFLVGRDSLVNKEECYNQEEIQALVFIPFGKWKSYWGVLLWLWIISTFLRMI